jgi:ubiquinone/menaquinone biosynthesis C-methylase UbiE
MKLDQARIRKILSASPTYYDQEKTRRSRDQRLNPSTRSFIHSQFEKSQKVLDVGCGNGLTLLEGAHLFETGIGIDESELHVAMARQNRGKSGAANVEFLVAKSVALPFKEGQFDFVFSERGPLSGNSGNIQSGLRVLKTGGMIFAETMGEMSWRETDAAFGRPDGLRYQHMRVAEETRVLFERNGVDIRINAEHFQKETYADIYEWLAADCASMAYAGEGSKADLKRIEAFYQANRNDKDEIVTTRHVVWIGGIKKAGSPEYWEYQHFPRPGGER